MTAATSTRGTYLAAIPSVDPYFKRPYVPGMGFYYHLAEEGREIGGTVVGAPAYAPPFKPYVYRGTGRDELTPWIDDLPEWTWEGKLTRRQERIEALAAMPLWHGTGEPPRGYITAHQAAERLGISVRTVERYKRELTRRPA